MLKRYSIWLLTTCILFLVGCSDEFYNIDNKHENELFESGLTICVPRTVTTRAISNPTSDELTLHSITLFLLRYENNEYKELVVKQLKDDRTAVKVTDSYEVYNVEDLPMGDYKVYICANMFNSAQDTDIKLAEEFSNVSGSQTVEEKILSYADNFGFSNFIYDLSADNVYGLPMSCKHSEFRTEKNTSTTLGNNYFTFTGQENLYADMTFALAKVTVEVEGASGENIEIKNATLSDYLNKFNLFDTKSFTGFTIGEDLSVNDLKDLVKRPVYVTETNGANDPKLTLQYEDKTVEIPLGEENESTGHHDIIRGFHYEYVIKRDGSIELIVKKWMPVYMDVAINGTIELVLQDTKIKEMVSGTWYEIAYRSNAEKIDIVSPTFTSGNKSIPFYSYQITPTHIRIRLNDNVSLKEYNDYANKDQLKYFHVMADNLMKRVDVQTVTAKANFDVTPQNIVIDLREMIASAKSVVVDTIKFSSNLEKVTTNILSVKWKDADGNTIDNLGYQIKESDFDLPVFDYQRPTPEAPNGEDYIVLRYLDQGAQFWQTEKTLEVTYTVSGSEDQMSQLTTGAEKTVTVRVIPFSSNYKIHFRANNGQDWVAPHIYVYQCLELPYGITNNAGRTVGVDGSDWAALEYNFTGDFAFKGWEGYGGSIWHNDGNGVDKNGFIFMTGFGYDGNVGGENDSKTYRWMKLNSEHYQKIASQSYCTSERCNGYKEVVQPWPGIVMYEEAKGGPLDGWWTYELSGVATPGKTLIMFSDGGAGNDIQHTGNKHRFPGNNCVGVALFDYEDKEGWFLLNNTSDKDYTVNHFYDDMPVVTTPEPEADVTIYGDYDFAFEGIGPVKAYFWNGGSNNGWPGTLLTEVTATNGEKYYCCKFDFNFTPANVKFSDPNNEKDQSGNHSLDSSYIYTWNGKTGKTVKFKKN